MGNALGYLFPEPEPDPDYSIIDSEYPVRRVVSLLENLTKVDAVVNSTDRSLNLGYGGLVSKTIISVAGEEIQNEICEKYPNGINTNEIACTKGYRLPYRYVYHCSLQSIEGRISHHLIRELVRKILKAASENKHVDSVAFPAIGTGAMNFPQTIIRSIYRACLQFMKENPDSLKVVYIIIHPSNTNLRNYIKRFNPAEEQERLNYRVDFNGWSQTDEIRKVEITGDKYDYVAKKFEETMDKKFCILKIEMIENKWLYTAHEYYRRSLPSNKQKSTDLWHGTIEENTNGIIRYGFDWRLARRDAFGKGCYFAKEAYYSNQDSYSQPNSKGEKFMFLAHVCIGNAMVGDSSMNEMSIPSNIQTTVDCKDKPTIYVTYDDDQTYPAFLVKYKLL